MASNPPSQVEDLTDEDFFDKLVDGDGDDVDSKALTSSGASVFVGENESDEAKAFANLSIIDNNEAENSGTDGWEFGIGDGVEVEKAIDDDVKPGNLEKSETSVVSSNSDEDNSMVELSSGNLETESPSNAAVDKGYGSGHSGVKEVGWSAFNAGSTTNGDTGFGSYSDFFNELGDGAGDAIGRVAENVNPEPEVVSGYQVDDSSYLNTSSSFSQYQEGYGYGAATESAAVGQGLNSSQYWENLYPGWKFDRNTGQWYQVDGYNAVTNIQGNTDWTISDGKPEISYLQQTAQSVSGAVAESGTTEKVTNWSQVSQASGDTGMPTDWNQASQVNNGYPSHMIFDPQYPGWYYDTIAQEWRALEAYAQLAQSIVQTENQLNQNGFSSSATYSRNDEQKMHDGFGQVDSGRSQEFSSKDHNYYWAQSFGNYNQQVPGMVHSHNVTKSEPVPEYRENQQVGTNYGHDFYGTSHLTESISKNEPLLYHGKTNYSRSEFSALPQSQHFVSGESFSHQLNQSRHEQDEHKHAPNEYFGYNDTTNFSMQPYQSIQQFNCAPGAVRSSAGRPPHALVSFGFGGKLIVMKNSIVGDSTFVNQNPVGGSISVLNLMDIATERVDTSSFGTGRCGYFQTICRQSFPGPLVGGNVSSKELSKWIDERIENLESPDMDYKKTEVLKLLMSLLKIACQYYGKLRSPFGSDSALKESDVPETAVAKLFASAKRSMQLNQYGAITQCIQQLPSEGQMQGTAAEVQGLLVSGRKVEALQCAQEGQLWGTALVLAAQLGDQFYAETVKQMALQHLVAGSPLRTLCLLISGHPAEIFSAGGVANSMMPGSVVSPRQALQFGANGMLDDWEENLAVITANRTKDDELVLIHLGDCLWKERSNIVAAHICYLVAEANYEPYSDTARLCLVGADHWKCPRTYASPEAIQRTELYEYSKVLGNSQYALLPFQPYKLVYAHMLVEVGRISDALKYCQALQKSLKNGRAPEVETLRQLVSSLEERIRTHQEGGFSANLAPGKLVGKLLNLIDTTAHRVVGGLPPLAPSTGVSTHEHHRQSVGPRVSSTMALMPSASMEPISGQAADSNRKTMHSRSVSEPDIGRSPRQGHVDSSEETSATNLKENATVGGKSRFGSFSFGSQLLQKTVGLVLKTRQGRQAKLGDENKFYYDEKLKRWVEAGVDPPAEETALPPPPTTTSHNGAPDYNLRNALKGEDSVSNGTPESKSPASTDSGTGIPPLPPTSNQFSARNRMGVRSRYVDTFNKGGGNPTNMFKSPSFPSIKPANAISTQKFFVPTPVTSFEQPVESSSNTVQDAPVNSSDPSIPPASDTFQSPMPSAVIAMQRNASMDSISNKQVTGGPSSFALQSRRRASWGGSLDEASSSQRSPNLKQCQEVTGMPPPSFMPSKNSSLMQSSRNGGSFGDLHEVEL